MKVSNYCAKKGFRILLVIKNKAILCWEKCQKCWTLYGSILPHLGPLPALWLQSGHHLKVLLYCCCTVQLVMYVIAHHQRCLYATVNYHQDSLALAWTQNHTVEAWMAVSSPPNGEKDFTIPGASGKIAFCTHSQLQTKNTRMKNPYILSTTILVLWL